MCCNGRDSNLICYLTSALLLSKLHFTVVLRVVLHVLRQLLSNTLLRAKESAAASPAAFDRLQIRVAVVFDEVLQKMLRHAEDQSAILPPAAVVLHQVELHSLNTAIIAACVDHTLVYGHAHHHVIVTPVHLQAVMGLELINSDQFIQTGCHHHFPQDDY